MSNNQVQRDAAIMNFVTAGAVAVGAVVPLQHGVGIALRAAAGSGETIPVALEGSFTVPKATGRAWVQGEKLVWDASTSTFDTTALTLATGDLTGCGLAMAAAASGDTTGVIKLTPGNVARQ